MEVFLPAGSYVVAVSGGVDSIVLLDLLVKLPGLELVVAHFDHGIRADSAEDRKFVGALAKNYGLDFVYSEGGLGPSASEALAREKRYAFLTSTMKTTNATAIITAHHQDDLLETAIINLMRGTGRRGLSSLKATKTIMRPLLGYSKQDIKNYAVKHKLTWNEDPTNADTKYLRNHVRHRIVANLKTADRGKLLAATLRAGKQNAKIDQLLAGIFGSASDKLDRSWFASLPHKVSLEVMAAWLRAGGITSYDKKALERLVIAAKTSDNNRRYNINKDKWLVIETEKLALEPKER